MYVLWSNNVPPGRHQSNHRDLLIFVDCALAQLAAARTRRAGLELCGASLPFRCKKPHSSITMIHLSHLENPLRLKHEAASAPAGW